MQLLPRSGAAQGLLRWLAHALIDRSPAAILLGRLLAAATSAAESLQIVLENTSNPMALAMPWAFMAIAAAERGDAATAADLAGRIEKVCLPTGRSMLALVKLIRGRIDLSERRFADAAYQSGATGRSRPRSWPTWRCSRPAWGRPVSGRRQATRGRCRIRVAGPETCWPRPWLVSFRRGPPCAPWPAHPRGVAAPPAPDRRGTDGSSRGRDARLRARPYAAGRPGRPGTARDRRDAAAPYRGNLCATAQELQIAKIAADGLTNREIGQQLFLSHRIVGSHLYRIFPKLGITTRSQLRDALPDGTLH